jgi:hypothetical protein
MGTVLQYEYQLHLLGTRRGRPFPGNFFNNSLFFILPWVFFALKIWVLTDIILFLI